MDYLSGLIEHAGVSIVIVDLAGNIIGFNPAAEQLYGYTAADVLGQHVSLLSPDYLRAEHERTAWMVAREGRPWDALTEQITRDQRVVAVRQIISPIKDSNGTLIGLSRLSLNMTEDLTVRQALQHERDLLEAILQSANDAIIMLDLNGVVAATNLQFETFFHLPQYQVANRTVDELVDMLHERPDLPPELTNLLLAFAADMNQSAAGDFEIGGAERRVLVWYSAPVHAHDGGTMGRLFVFRDATHEREVDRMKTEFVSLVSHELRTPLTSIQGFAEILLDGDAGELNDDARHFAEIIKVNSERLTSLINAILDLTRIEAGRIELQPDRHQIGKIIGSVIISMRPLVEARRQHLRAELSPDLPPVWVDADRIAQVMTNLLSNASKYTGEGGIITVCAEYVAHEDQLPSGAPDGVTLPAVMVMVRDTGIGIALEDQPQVFARFFRADEAQQRQIQGSGLGLAIVKSFIELHGGKVWLHSEPGQGSSFYFTVPIVEGG